MTPTSQSTSRRSERGPAIVVLILMLAFVAIMSTLSLLRYAAIHAHADLATYSQVVWNTARGDWFRTSILPFTANYLGNHFTPILAAFVPFYALWPDPRVLLIAQVILNALAAWPLFCLAREKLPTAWAAVLLVGGLFLYPALHHQNLVDFHGIALATPAVMLAFYALLTERDHLLLGAIGLMILIREDVCLVIIVMGVYAFLVQRRRRWGLFLFGLGIVLSALVIQVLIPAFRVKGAFFYNDYYDYLGDSPAAMLRTALLEPQVWLSRVFHPPKLKTLLQLLLPVALLPLLSPAVFLLGGSALAYLLLVDLPFHHVYRLNSQYQALFIPVFFVGAVLGIVRLVRWLGPRWGERRVALGASGLVLVACAISLFFWGPLADVEKRADFRPTEQSQREWQLLSQIPPDAGVVAASRFTAPLSTREGLFMFGGLFEYPYSLDYLIYADTPVGYPPHQPAYLGQGEEQGWQVPRYERIDRAGTTELQHQTGAVLAARLPEAQAFSGMVALRGASGVGETLTAAPGQPIEVALVWECLQNNIPRLVFFAQLLESRPDSSYRWASTDREFYNGLFPTDKWVQGVIMGDLFTVYIPPWMPPGRYELHVGAYDRETMGRLWLPDGATTVVATTIDIASPAPIDPSTVEVPIGADQPMAPGLTLLGYNPVPEQATHGQVLDVTLYWHSTEPMKSANEVQFDLIAEGQEEATTQWTRLPTQGLYPTDQWAPGTVLAGWYDLRLPDDLAPGRYTLSVSVLDSGTAGPQVPIVTLDIAPAQ